MKNVALNVMMSLKVEADPGTSLPSESQTPLVHMACALLVDFLAAHTHRGRHAGIWTDNRRVKGQRKQFVEKAK